MKHERRYQTNEKKKFPLFPCIGDNAKALEDFLCCSFCSGSPCVPIHHFSFATPVSSRGILSSLRPFPYILSPSRRVLAPNPPPLSSPYRRPDAPRFVSLPEHGPERESVKGGWVSNNEGKSSGDNETGRGRTHIGETMKSKWASMAKTQTKATAKQENIG
jgi:hypothetical protein